MIEIHYCGHCKKETVHEVEIERDATKPPESFIEAEQEGYASNADCIFYDNGDSDYNATCSICFNSFLMG